MRLLARCSCAFAFVLVALDARAQEVMRGVLGIPMDRMGSGTTWIPDAVSIPSRHAMLGEWSLTLHGFVFGEYDKQGGPRGGDQFGSLNWGMLMANHALSGGQLQLRTMLSLDPASVTPRGYPLLLQSGESYHGAPLHDRQHPHDFWMELGATYDHALSRGIGLQVYVAPSGEPALGPVAFMHRPSATDNLSAPLGHHWQDATHVSFGVATIGVYSTRWKLEGSTFNGREPDDQRWDFDFGKLDSYSGRLTVNPNAHWSATAGYGFIRDMEAPGDTRHRVVASVMHGVPLGEDGQLTTTLIFGVNTLENDGWLSHSALVESEWVINANNTLFARAESVHKSADELQISDNLGQFDGNSLFAVRSASVGYVREFARIGGATIGIGATGTVNFVPGALESFYGSRTPVGGMFFLRIRTAKDAMAGMPGM